jgi:hypothetical protein
MMADRRRPYALSSAASVASGAECLIIDAEKQYEGRYAAAQVYLHRLRAAAGHRYRLGPTSFPYVDYPSAFPYSVFLGPGGAQFNLPQMYWRDIGASVDAVFRHTYATNRIYHRPIVPLGQTDHGAPAGDVRRFRALTVRYRAGGISWWDFAWTAANALWPAIAGPFAPAGDARRPGFRVLRRGDKGDDVVWLQEHLASTVRRAGGRRPVGSALGLSRRLPTRSRSSGLTTNPIPARRPLRRTLSARARRSARRIRGCGAGCPAGWRAPAGWPRPCDGARATVTDRPCRTWR